MFQLTLVDHIRLSFGGVVHSYKAHSEVAERLTQRVWQMRIGELALLGSALAAAVTAAIRADARYATLAAILAGGALALFTFYVAVNLESRIYAHRWCAARLWLIREQYRALLSEISDGVLDVDAVRERRNQLMNELHAVDEHAPMIDRPTFQSVRQSLAAGAELAFTNEEIDAFLPASLRTGGHAAPGEARESSTAAS